MTRRSASGQSGEKAGPAPKKVLLVFANGASESDGLLADLQGEGFQLIRTATIENAESTLRQFPISLAIVCPEAAAATVEQLVSVVEGTRRGIPLLAIRNRHSGDPDSWARLGIGILRCPLLPGALTRSVEVVLRLKRTG